MTTVLDPNIILTKNEFLALPKEQRRELMEYWRTNYSTKKIRKIMGYHNSTAFYNMLKSLGLPTNLAKPDNSNTSHTKKNLKNEPIDTWRYYEDGDIYYYSGINDEGYITYKKN